MTTAHVQREFTVTDDLTPYRGSWVAIRSGKVVASAVDPIELRENPDVRQEDWFLLVPTELDGSFLL